MAERFGGEVVNVDDYAKDFMVRLALHERDRLRSRSYQRDEEPTVAQAVVATVIVGIVGWLALAKIWRLIRRSKR